MTPEGIVEEYFVNQTKKHGAYPMKFKSPSKAGVPDQICLYKGKTYFCEIKAPGEKPRPNQVKRHQEFKKHGVNVFVLDTTHAVDKFITEILKANPIEIKKRKSKNLGFVLKEGE